MMMCVFVGERESVFVGWTPVPAELSQWLSSTVISSVGTGGQVLVHDRPDPLASLRSTVANIQSCAGKHPDEGPWLDMTIL